MSRTLAARIALSTLSVISSLACATTSPVSGSTMFLASTRPYRKSSGTDTRWMPPAARSRRCLALIRLSFSTITLPSRSAMSKRAISPFQRSATNSIMPPSLLSSKLSKSKKCARIDSGVMPMAFSRIVTGILRRRSTRKNSTSLGSNSKSSHEPR
ncbi:Uncharacterised protein [Bordetella pertussis]|nr:Uncharacterised protein [Bordetella pertussis]CPM21164.1 Uncharacterised protein [Bordetella pertussis]